MNKIGIDIGGTKIECVVLSDDNKIIHRERVPTGNVFTEVKELVDNAVKITKINGYTVGVCMPGSISQNTGLMKNSNIRFLNGTDFIGILERKLQQRILVANDSQCFATAEALLGAGLKYDNVFGMILGTGVGGGYVIRGRVHKGFQGICSEWGHTNLDPSNNILCRCGRTGCVETWLSGTGVNKWAGIMFNDNSTTEQHLQSTVVQEIYFQRFGMAVANLIQTIDPDCIVIGGGVSNNDLLYTKGVASVKQYLFNDELRTPIVKAKLGDSAGVIGAALLWQTI